MIQQQPFRRGARSPNLALSAMLKGRSASGHNSADLTRATQALLRAAKERRDRKRPARPQRPARPPR